MGNPVGVKSVMRSTVSKYEQEQKEKFIQVMSDPRMRYSDALNFVENEIKQSKRMGTFNHKILCFIDSLEVKCNFTSKESKKLNLICGRYIESEDITCYVKYRIWIS